ncbi:MAG: hypothetical protein IPH62_00915 [Ignavibacteriae bacterium]|nr:hypothetical protein [Ignavibacteriota bacterium]
MRKKIIIIVLLVFTISCDEMKNTGSGHLYKGNLTDEILIVEKSDTLNIVLQYYQNPTDSIPYIFIQNNDNNELISLKLYVSYGSISEEPKINKEVIFISDTIYVWYSNDVYTNINLYKSNFLIDAISEPIIEYVKIDSIKVESEISKKIKLKFRNQFL